MAWKQWQGHSRFVSDAQLRTDLFTMFMSTFTCRSVAGLSNLCDFLQKLNVHV